MGRLMSGPNPFGISGRRVGPTFVGRLVLEPNPSEALGLGRLAGDVGPGPTTPTYPTSKCLRQTVILF